MISEKILTIISEYNPLHFGHIYHLEESIKKTNPSIKIAIISGNFVQRGEPAILNKWERAKIALEAGFDLVIELPCIYAISSAENFANGAIKIANQLNSSYISFGSECGDLKKLQTLSSLINKNEKLYSYSVKNKISKGFSYPKAQELVISDLFGNEFANICKSNNILGLEYLKSLSKINSNIIPITVKRNNANKLSSSEIRKSLRANNLTNLEKTKSLPEFVLKALKENINNGNLVFSLKSFEKELFYKLRTTNIETIKSAPDIPENMISNLKKYSENTNSLEILIQSLKNKSITQARIQRILLYILLGITKKDMEISKSTNPYIRVLAMNKNGKKILSSISPLANVITSVKDFESKCSNQDLLRILAIDKQATNIYTLAYQNNSKSNLDYTTKIITK